MYSSQVLKALEGRVRTETFFLRGFHGVTQASFRHDLLEIVHLMAHDTVGRILDYIQAAEISLARENSEEAAIAAELAQEIRRVTGRVNTHH